MCEQDDTANEWGLPIGQMVLSEAFTLEQSLSLTENLKKFGSATQQLLTVRAILTDDSRSEAERVSDALKVISGDAPQICLSKIEEQKPKRLAQMIQMSQQIVGEATTKIDLTSQDDLQSEEERQITNGWKTGQKQEQTYSLTADVSEIFSLLRAKQQELVRFRQQREEEGAQHRKQVDDLTRKLRVTQERLSGCSCKPEKAQEVGKMNKWLETLNKLLYGAQKQAAASREELRRSCEMSAKQFREKDERIRCLEFQLQLKMLCSNNSDNAHFSS